MTVLEAWCFTALQDGWVTATSREDQATTLGFWNPIPELPRCVDPQTNGLLCADEGGLLGGTVCGAPRQLRHDGPGFRHQ